MTHKNTDPACIHYKETGLFRRYLNERGRGMNCNVCVPPINAAVRQLVGMAESLELLRKNPLIDDDEMVRAGIEARSYRTAAALIQKSNGTGMDEA